MTVQVNIMLFIGNTTLLEQFHGLDQLNRITKIKWLHWKVGGSWYVPTCNKMFGFLIQFGSVALYYIEKSKIKFNSILVCVPDQHLFRGL